MKIVSIFASKLFSFQYDKEVINEYDRLMEQWVDVSYLRRYAKANGITDITPFTKEIIKDAEFIQDFMAGIVLDRNNIDHFFRPLDNREKGIKVLSKQKGKNKGSELRIYAIRIDKGIYVVTGGAIKLKDNFRMQDHPDTAAELVKLNKAQDFLKLQGIVDDYGFFEFINESQDEQ